MSKFYLFSYLAIAITLLTIQVTKSSKDGFDVEILCRNLL